LVKGLGLWVEYSLSDTCLRLRVSNSRLVDSEFRVSGFRFKGFM